MENLNRGAQTADPPTPDGGVPSPAEPTVHELKAEISETQDQLHQTLTAIQERLSPAHLAEQAKNSVRDATIGKVTHMAEQVGDTATRMVDQTRRAASSLPDPIRNNPWPLALIGVGVAWFFVRSRSQASAGDWQRGDNRWQRSPSSGRGRWERSYGDGRAGYTSDMSPSDWSAGDVAGGVQEFANDARESARDLSQRTQARVGRTLDANPMLLGAVALAAGALVGTLMPGTDLEDSYMGETRDTLVESAREMAEDKVQELSQAVRDAAPQPPPPDASLSSPS